MNRVTDSQIILRAIGTVTMYSGAPPAKYILEFEWLC